METGQSKAIKNYIENNPNCKKAGIEKIYRVKYDKLIEIEVYNLPINLLRYNIGNGRFKYQYKNELKKLGRSEKEGLNPDWEAEEDIEILEILLKENKPVEWKELMRSLDEEGQREPGIITYDGYLLNGNRRVCALRNLQKDNPEKKSRYESVDVALCPADLNAKEKWAIEARKQFTRTLKSEYDRINIVLKIRDGIEIGFSAEEAAHDAGEDAGKVEDFLKEGELYDKYLKHISADENDYSKINQRTEAFIAMRKFENHKDWGQNKAIEAKEKKFTRTRVFSMIEARIPQGDIRLYSDMKRNMPNIAKSLDLDIDIARSKLTDGDIDSDEFAKRIKTSVLTAKDSHSIEKNRRDNNPDVLLGKAVAALQGIKKLDENKDVEGTVVESQFELILKIRKELLRIIGLE